MTTQPSPARPQAETASNDGRPGILIANRGEIACRIVRTAQAAGLRAVALRSQDEEALGAGAGLLVDLADEIVTLPGVGASAYLDVSAIVAAASAAGCTYIHPGYGFLSESRHLAHACAEAGLTWVGHDAAALELFGDKRATRVHAEANGVPVPPSTGLLATDVQSLPATLDEVGALLSANPDGIAVKAVAGGGGRGIRIVTDPKDLTSALRSCAAEAQAGFDDARIFAEALITGARHIEVQVIGTDSGVLVLGDRDCSIQRRRQKLIEIAPAPGLSEEVRARLHADAGRLFANSGYCSLATVEFLVTESQYFLLEVNPRIQVEHTVTEAVTGIDLVAAQLDVARGIVSEGLVDASPRGTAIEARVSAESVLESGEPAPSTGEIISLVWPTGPGVRVDTWARSGTRVTGSFDPLLGKIIVTAATLAGAESALGRVLTETSVVGLETNRTQLQAILEVLELGNATTQSFDEASALIQKRADDLRRAELDGREIAPGEDENCVTGACADPEPNLEDGESLVRAGLSGAVVGLSDEPGEYVLLEAMKMHHPVAGPPGRSVRHLVSVGDQVTAGQPVAILTDAGDTVESHSGDGEPHPGVAEVQSRHAGVLDDSREEQVAKVRARGRRTARENIADLVDDGTFIEYGPLVIAAQTRRRSIEDLVAKTAADGLIGGTALIDGREVVVMSYDYSVLAGTQGARNHAKTDRLIQLAESKGIPLVLFAEGGGGRPGDTDKAPSADLHVPTFASLARLRGRSPLVAVVSGRTFAGNAALAGVCDVIIATAEVSLGMGGPAMIEGGGLGRYSAEEVGPASVHTANGVVDLLVPGDAEAVTAARDVLRYLRGDVAAGGDTAPDGPGRLNGGSCDAAADRARTVVPADRLRAFDIRDAIRTVADEGDFLELRPDFAPGAVTGLLRVDGHPCAAIANDNHHLGGAIDVDAARSLTQHLGLADDHGLPVISFIDTPGFMVGPEAEREPGVRAFGDLFVAGARLSVPFGAVIVRKGYGLGAMAMAAGGFKSNTFTIAWPSGEIGPMGLEGAVRLGYSKELGAIADPGERQQREQELIAAEYERGKAMSAAMVFDVDDVIDPADTRNWVRTLLRER